jgi:hypothetical protein
MANTMTLIASSTVGSGGASSIDFTSIPATYTDLLFKLSVRDNNAYQGDDLALQFNGVASGYTNKTLYGNGSSAASIQNTYGSTVGYFGPGSAGANSGANVFGNTEVYVPNYAGSNYKSWSSDALTEYNGTSVYMAINAGLWSNSAAITSIKILMQGGGTSFSQYSTAYLFGIKSS